MQGMSGERRVNLVEGTLSLSSRDVKSTSASWKLTRLATNHIMRYLLVAFLLLASLGLGATVHAQSDGRGACSSHGGVSCSSGADSDGSVVCVDGWRESSVNFSSVCSAGNNGSLYDGYFFDESKVASACSEPDQYKSTFDSYAGAYLGVCTSEACPNGSCPDMMTFQSVMQRCANQAGDMAHEKIKAICKEDKEKARPAALAKCPKGSWLTSDLKCVCPLGQYLDTPANSCKDWPFVGKPKNKGQLAQCAVIAVKSKKVYYLPGSKSVRNLKLSSVDCLLNESTAAKMKLKKGK